MTDAAVIAVMNAKGGVGKSTLALVVGEFLAMEYDSRVLLIDADPQSSLSLMMMTPDRWQKGVLDKATIADLYAFWHHQGKNLDFGSFIASDVSNFDARGRLSLMPGSVDLSYVERHMSGPHVQYVTEITRKLIAYCKKKFDYVLIDCQPSVTQLTELWLHYSDYHLVPAKADFPSYNGVAIVDQLLGRMQKDGAFVGEQSKRIGIVFNMHKRKPTNYQKHWEAEFRKLNGPDCFEASVPDWVKFAQLSSLMTEDEHGHGLKPQKVEFADKYPEDAVEVAKSVIDEMRIRIKRRRRT